MIRVGQKTKWYLQDNPACRKTRIVFFIVGVNVAPAKITQALQITPTEAYAKGDMYTSRVGQRARSFGQWRLQSDQLVHSTSTEQHAQAILRLLEPVESFIKNYIKKATDRVGISVYWEAADTSHGGFTLTGATFCRLGALCGELDIRFVSGRRRGP